MTDTQGTRPTRRPVLARAATPPHVTGMSAATVEA